MFPLFCISNSFQIIKQSSGKSGGSSDTPKALAPNLGGHSATEKCGNNAKQGSYPKICIPLQTLPFSQLSP